MRKLLLIIFIFLFGHNINASHIIGGNISISYANTNQYDITVEVFRDDVFGILQLPDSIEVGIYEIGTNNLLTLAKLPLDTIFLLDLGDSCFVPDTNTLRIEEGIYKTTASINIPNYSLGYYFQTQFNARTPTAANLDLGPPGQDMTLYAELKDPAIGPNSSPVFSVYSNDTYFCVNSTNIKQFNATDPDGDSLYYSFVTPLTYLTGSSGSSSAGTGAYPYYPEVPWDAGYNLSNIIGGTSPMTINPNTGEITASPNLQNYFVFCVRVEEYRSGVKIGEVRRDIQYISLLCQNSIITSVNISNDTIYSDHQTSVHYPANYQWLDCNTGMYLQNDTNKYLYPPYNGSFAVEISNCYNVDTSTCSAVNPCSVTPNFNYVNNGNGNYSFTNTSTGNYIISNWYFGDGDSSSTTNPNHTFLTNGTYLVTLVIADTSILNNGPCQNYYHTSLINVTGVPTPLACNAGFTMYPDSTNYTNIIIYNSSTGNNLSYFWDFGDGDTSNVQHPSHTYASSGPYYLCLSIDDGTSCTDLHCDSIGTNGYIFKQASGFTINVISNTTTSIQQKLLDKGDIKIFPNPASNLLNIESTSPINEIIVLDFTGKAIKKVSKPDFQININEFSSGIYFIQIRREKEVVTKKFIKQ